MKPNSIFLFTFLFLSVCAQAETPDEIRNSIQQEMSQRHPENPAPFWTSLGTDALPVIQQMYSETKKPYEKMWLLDGMGYFTDSSVGSFLQSEISNSTDNLIKGKMLTALIHSQGEAVLGFVAPYLNDKDANIRLEVASDLKQYSSIAPVKAKLDQFEANEKIDWVKSRYEKVDKVPVLRRSGMLALKRDEAMPTPTPLPEKSWAGEWKGVFISTKKTSAVSLNLKALTPKTPLDAKWKMELTLPKQSKFELQGKEIEMSYFQTKDSHWLEIKDKKDERVVVVRRPGVVKDAPKEATKDAAKEMPKASPTSSVKPNEVPATETTHHE